MNIRLTRTCGGLVVIAGSLIGIVGCGGAYDASVAGSVTLDGNAVPRGTITFAPVNGGPAGYARIDGGKYTVYTGREEGLPAGDYDVTVISNEAAAAQANANGGPPPPGKAITPAWYRAKDTSGLKFTVKPGSNSIDLPLNSTPPAGWKGKK
jgi:hypothetical protein